MCLRSEFAAHRKLRHHLGASPGHPGLISDARVPGEKLLLAEQCDSDASHPIVGWESSTHHPDRAGNPGVRYGCTGSSAVSACRICLRDESTTHLKHAELLWTARHWSGQ